MKKILILLVSLGIAFSLAGCFGKMEIATCKTFKNDVCEVKKVSIVRECAKPIIIDSKTYCKE